jgi:ParB family chromosome partitioning protein
MGRNNSEALGAQGRRDAHNFDPTRLTIIGLDTKDGPAHPLYDDRIHLKLDPAFVRNIEYHGVLEPVLVRRNGEDSDGSPRIEVVAGRQRVRAARAANEEREKRGEPLVLVPALVQKGDDAKIAEIMVTENEGRVNDNPTTRAKKMQRLLDLGRDEESIARSFCCTVQTVKSTLALLDLAPAVQKAVDGGTITATLASQEFTKIAREEQPAKLEQLVASGATKGAAAKEAMGNLRKGREAAAAKEAGANTPRMKSRKYLEQLAEALTEADEKTEAMGQTVALLRFLLGNEWHLRHVEPAVAAVIKAMEKEG